ncbi:MAG: DUF885 domain-containing protein [Woeseiaceae bacterium]|nr:DUF885 domain-containing protein [Woeseiaceae bacterium]
MKRSVLLAALALTACSEKAPDPAAVDTTIDTLPSIEDIADNYINAYLERFPEMATYYGLSGFRHNRLTDMSESAINEWRRTQDAVLTLLEANGRPEEIGSRDWVTYGVLHEELTNAAETRRCQSHLWAASTATAWHTTIPFLFDYQPLTTAENRQDALDRLTALGPFIDQDIANLREGLRRGYSAPRVTVEKVPAQVRSLLEEKNPFLGMAARVGDKEFSDTAVYVYDTIVAPAIERYASFIEDEYLPAARTEVSLAANPNGDRCYTALVRSFTSVSMDADEIHELGLKQMALIQQQFREVIDEHFDGLSTPELLRTINSDPSYTFDSEQAVIDYSARALDEAKAAMPRAFGRLPKAEVIIKPYPDFADSGVGGYLAPAEDGSRPGIFWIAVVEPQTRTRATQKSTLYHETYPGHHLQGSIALELGDSVHPVARYFGSAGFSEGWALYSERVAGELGLYDDPVDMLGLLSDQGARAARLVVDTGLHTRNWSREQAVDYMLANTGWAETDIQNDVNRYISWPGQANSYMLGKLEIDRLRQLAEDELGDGFDIRDFHDRVLENGAITLPMLEQRISGWVEAVKLMAEDDVPGEPESSAK